MSSACIHSKSKIIPIILQLYMYVCAYVFSFFYPNRDIFGKFSFILCACVGLKRTCAMVYMYKSENSLWESGLSFCYIRSRDWTQFIRLDSRLAPLPTKPPCQPLYYIFKLCFHSTDWITVIFWKNVLEHVCYIKFLGKCTDIDDPDQTISSRGLSH